MLVGAAHTRDLTRETAGGDVMSERGPRTGSWVLAMLMSSGIMAAQATRVLIDVAPGDSPTVLEAGRGGLLPVAVLSTAQFDAASVDPATALFGPAGKGVEAVRAVTEDVDRDGRMDVMLLVRVTDLELTCGEVVLHLTAQTRAGARVEGSETVTVVGCGPG
jgi:hypothetical protein